MKKNILGTLGLTALLAFSCMSVQSVVYAEPVTEDLVYDEKESEVQILSNDDILIRDPYVVLYDGNYYLYGTNGANAFSGKMDSFHVYVSSDLNTWEGPYTIYQNDGTFWADAQYWAPEVYVIDDTFYLYGSMGGSTRENKGIQLFTADNPLGEFTPNGDTTITPEDVDAIDATLYEEDGTTYMIYSHGTEGIYAVALTDDLTTEADPAFKLFDVSGCGWAVDAFGGMMLNDGPALYVRDDGTLVSFFSTMSEDGYHMGYAVSDNGKLDGNWTCSTDIIETGSDGGHCMVFKNVDGDYMVAYHAPNGESHPVFQYLIEKSDGGFAFSDTKE